VNAKKFDIDLFEALNREYADHPVARPPSDPGTLSKRAGKRADRIEVLCGVRNRRILELGCGRGELASELAERGAEVIAVDVTSYPEWNQRARPRLRFVEADLAAGHSISPASIDVLCSVSVLEHVRRPIDMLCACRDLLAPGGRFLLVAHLYRSATGSHRSREVFFPWPHLLFTDDVFEEFYRRRGRPPIGPAWLNKLTYADYFRAFDQIGLTVEKEFKRRRVLDAAFHARFYEELSKYSDDDLVTNAVDVLLSADRPRDPGGRTARQT